MVVPVGPIFPGRGKAPLQPQAYYVQTYVGQTPNLDTIFRGPLKGLPEQPPPPNAFQSWTYSYNLNLIGQDRFPTGEQFWERPTLPIPPLAPTWIASGTFPPMMAGALVGVTVRPPLKGLPEQPPQLLQQSVFQNLNVTTLRPTVVTFIKRQSDWPAPFAPQQPAQSWTASYNLNLIGQDRLPIGEQVWERPTLPILPALTWLEGPQYELIAKPFAQTDWPNPTPAYRLEQTWAAAYNKNLIAQDAMVTGEQLSELPPRDFARVLQTWIQQTNLALLTQPPILNVTIGKYFDRPQLAVPPAQSWEFAYNKNLIGQDQLPTRQQDWPNPIPPALVKDWIQSTNLALLTQPPALLPYHRTHVDLPIAGPQQSAQTWIASYNLNLIGKDQLPIGAGLVELAPAQKPPEQVQLHSWAWWYNLNLVAQDQLPFRQSDWPLTPAAQRAADLATWIDRAKFWLLGTPVNQTYWPNPTQPFRDPSLASFGRGYNLDLIGQDRLPTRQSDWPNPTPPLEYSLLRAFILPLNLPLVPSVVLAPPLLMRNQDWPNPTAAAYPSILRAWPTQGSPAPIIPGIAPPPPTGPAVYNKPMLAGPGYLNVIPGEKPS
jgi:hypothetical protein